MKKITIMSLSFLIVMTDSAHNLLAKNNGENCHKKSKKHHTNKRDVMQKKEKSKAKSKSKKSQPQVEIQAYNGQSHNHQGYHHHGAVAGGYAHHNTEQQQQQYRKYAAAGAYAHKQSEQNEQEEAEQQATIENQQGQPSSYNSNYPY